jgi:hypothetical protein
MDPNSQAMIAKQGIIDVNNLSYNLKPDLSVTTSRTTTTQFFQNNEYAENATMVCILNTGASFIYGPNTTIAFDILTTLLAGGAGDNNGIYFPSPGSAANIFSRITIMSRSGVVLERIDSVNILSAIKTKYEHDKTWVESIGSLMGYDNKLTPFIPGALPVRAQQRFVIPMSQISGLFSYENLLPSALMSGLRIEIALAPANQAFTKVTGTDASRRYGYSVIQPRIQCDAYMLTDSIMRSLNEAAASSGLEVVFPTYFTTIQSRNTTLLNMESRRACSRALSAFYLEQTPLGNNFITGDTSTMSSKSITAGGPVSVQFRAGSLYFPNTAVAGTTADLCGPENFQMALQCFNKYNTTISASVTYYDYYDGGSLILGSTLERSTALDLTGIPLSNSRVLALNATFANANPTTGYLFLQYVTLARVFISNCTVEV